MNKSSSILKIPLVSLLVFLFWACPIAIAKQSSGSFKIHRVKLDQKSFNPSENEVVKVSFEVTRDSGVVIFIFDQLGRKVWQDTMSNCKAGRSVFNWDGRSLSGNIAEGDVFLYAIEATDKDGVKVLYNPVANTGGVEAAPMEFDTSVDGEIEFVLPKTCMVRIRPSIVNGPFFNPIVKWKPYTAGRHTVKWDGKDNSGMINLSSNKNIRYQIDCYTLPSNTIIFDSSTVPLRQLQDSNSENRSVIWSTKGKCMYYVQNPIDCTPAKFAVEYLGRPLTKEGVPVLSGNIHIKIDIAKEDLQRLINSRFGLTVYLDGVYIHGIDETTSPVTFDIDTNIFSKGIHLLTYNIISYDDHIRSLTQKIIVGE